MTALLIYLAIALGFSFICSIAEAVLLSVTTAHLRLAQEEEQRYASLMLQMKRDIDAPLAAILTLNTIAHTAGAAGVGAQAAKVFGDASLGIVSAVLTLLILVFSEIIPKTLGSVYWRQCAPTVTYLVKYLMMALLPFVWMSKQMTQRISGGHQSKGFSRDEFSVMVALGEKEGELSEQEARMLQNVFLLRGMSVTDVMTPRAVMFSLDQSTSVDLFFAKYEKPRFSRIPIYAEDSDDIRGFVLRTDLLKAKARDNGEKLLEEYGRELTVIHNKLSLLDAFEQFLQNRAHIMIVADEYGSVQGLITLEDIFETLMGLEIVDEKDYVADLQKLARDRWRKHAESLGIDLDD